MDNDEFILCILPRLGSKFDSIVSALNARDNFLPLENVIGKLRDFDLWISSATHNNYTTIALYTNHAAESKSNENKPDRDRGSNSRARGTRGVPRSHDLNSNGRAQPSVYRDNNHSNLAGGGRTPRNTCFQCGGP